MRRREDSELSHAEYMTCENKVFKIKNDIIIGEDCYHVLYKKYIYRPSSSFIEQINQLLQI